MQISPRGVCRFCGKPLNFESPYVCTDCANLFFTAKNIVATMIRESYVIEFPDGGGYLISPGAEIVAALIAENMALSNHLTDVWQDQQRRRNLRTPSTETLEKKFAITRTEIAVSASRQEESADE